MPPVGEGHSLRGVGRGEVYEERTEALSAALGSLPHWMVELERKDPEKES